MAHAEVDGDRFVSDELWNIRISAPASWRMSEQKSYAAICVKASGDACSRENEQRSHSSILLWMHRRSPPGRMLLSAERLHGRLTSREYADKTRALLIELGFRVRNPQLHAGTGAYWLECDNGTAFLPQAVLVSGSIGYSLTLSAPDQRTRAKHLRAFDYALRSIRLDRDSSQRDSSESLPPDGSSNSSGQSRSGQARSDGDRSGRARSDDSTGGENAE